MTEQFTQLSVSGVPGMLYEGFDVGLADVNPQDCVHLVSADQVPIAQHHRLGVVESIHPTYSEIVALAQKHGLSVADAAHIVYSDPARFITNVFPEDSAHPTTATAAGLSQGHLFGTEESVHLTTAEAVSIVQRHGLRVSESGHVHTADGVKFGTLIPFHQAPDRRTIGISIDPRILELETALRVLGIDTEQRTFVIDSVLRTININASPRIFEVEQETRTISISPDERTKKRTI